jgi:group I intron endonuclease
MGSIYKITNIVNQKSYIGISIHEPKSNRIRKHLTGHGSQELASDLEEYGRDAFMYKILEEDVFPELLSDLEKAYIAKFGTLVPNGYNRTRGAGGTSGLSHSEESREQMSNAHQGKKLSSEHRKNISTAMKGKKPSNLDILHSKACREKVGLALRGRSRPQDVCEKISAAQRSPYYNDVYEYYFSLPSNMNVSEKRDMLHEKFLDIVPRYTINKWVRRWYVGSMQTNDNEGVVKPPKILSKAHCQKVGRANRGDDYEDAYTFFLSLPSNMNIDQKRLLLRKEFPDTKNDTMNKRLRKWQTELESIRTS